MPGHEKEAIDLRIKDNKLVISSERKSQIEENNGKKIYRREISYGNFSRVIPLPLKVINEKIEASLNNGVLIVTAPIDTTVVEDENGFKIKIK
jgi:HSP20 family protein